MNVIESRLQEALDSILSLGLDEKEVWVGYMPEEDYQDAYALPNKAHHNPGIYELIGKYIDEDKIGYFCFVDVDKMPSVNKEVIEQIESMGFEFSFTRESYDIV